jgi:trimeric autotransporter adhesin
MSDLASKTLVGVLLACAVASFGCGGSGTRKTDGSADSGATDGGGDSASLSDATVRDTTASADVGLVTDVGPRGDALLGTADAPADGAQPAPDGPGFVDVSLGTPDVPPSTDTPVAAVDGGAVDAGSDDAAGTDAQLDVVATADVPSVPADAPIPVATVIGLQVTPTNPSIALGTKRQFTVIATWSNGTASNVSDVANWSTSNPAVATVSDAAATKGLATSVATGTATISAAFAGLTGSTTLTVTAAVLTSIDVTPTNPSIASGTSLSFVATGVFSDNSTQNLTSTAAWSSSNQAVATVSNTAGSEGVASGVTSGSATITASFGGQTGSSNLTVTSATLTAIQVSPTNPSIAPGTSQTFTATGVYSDSSSQDLTEAVSWNSSDGAVATVSNTAGSKGEVSGVAQGTATITASLDGKTGSTTVTVTVATLESIEITPEDASIAAGTTATFVATGIFSDNSTQDLTETATWSSSNEAAATVSNAAGSQGVATGVAQGSATITASFGGKTGSAALTVTTATLTSIAVTPASPSIVVNTTVQFVATGTYSDGSKQDLTSAVTWTAANAGVATLSNASGSQGLATGVAAGTTGVSATLGGITGSASLTVVSATLTSIAISPLNSSIVSGTVSQFTATGTYSNGSMQDITTSVTWTSSNESAATISNAAGFQGEATGVAAGTTTITASLSGISASTTLTVTNAVLSSLSITPANPTISVGGTLQFTVTGHFDDGTTQDLTRQATWTSTTKSVAAVSNARKTRGVVTAVSPGTTTATASTIGMQASTVITVVP